MIEEKEFETLELHESCFISQATLVLKVKDGWIYKFLNGEGRLMSTCFVPDMTNLIESVKSGIEDITNIMTKGRG